jgi:hypothetical protein
MDACMRPHRRLIGPGFKFVSDMARREKPAAFITRCLSTPCGIIHEQDVAYVVETT